MEKRRQRRQACMWLRDMYVRDSSYIIIVIIVVSLGIRQRAARASALISPD